MTSESKAGSRGREDNLSKWVVAENGTLTAQWGLCSCSGVADGACGERSQTPATLYRSADHVCGSPCSRTSQRFSRSFSRGRSWSGEWTMRGRDNHTDQHFLICSRWSLISSRAIPVPSPSRCFTQPYPETHLCKESMWFQPLISQMRELGPKEGSGLDPDFLTVQLVSPSSCHTTPHFLPSWNQC